MMYYILTWLISSFINGLLFFVIFSFLVYCFYLKELPYQPKKIEPQFEKFILNQLLTEFIDTHNEGSANTPSSTEDRELLSGNNETAMALNMVFQFLFQELKDTKEVRRYIIRKLSFEFNELLTTKAAGKFLQKITARDFSLGTSFPIIHDLKLHSYEMDKERKILQEISIIVDLEYTNGFSLSIDADLILGRSAYVHVKIVSIKGKARLQFTRYPFTHWNFAFIEDPIIEFDATSHFDGRQIPQLTMLILTQLRKSVRRKHTLPNYKCRFRPFFEKIYTPNLYRTDLDEILRKRSSSELLESLHTPSEPPLSRKGSTDTLNSENLGDSFKSTKFKHTKSTRRTSAKLTAIYTSYQYRKLCEKLGFDLTSKGRLTVKLQTCDRLPESLYSMNLLCLNQLTPGSAVTSQVGSVSGAPEQATFISITTSIDKVSMKLLMERQVCKDHWPYMEFEVVKTTNDLGFVFMDQIFINRNEVIVKKLLPDTPAAAFTGVVKMFDIVYSMNQTRIANLKHLSKLIKNAVLNSTLKFVIQRPCILLENIVMTSSKSVQANFGNKQTETAEPNPKTPEELPVVEKEEKLTNSMLKLVQKPQTSTSNVTSFTSSNSTDSTNATQSTTAPLTIPTSNNASTSNTHTTTLFPNTRLKFENLFSEKTKLKLFPAVITSAASNVSTTSANPIPEQETISSEFNNLSQSLTPPVSSVPSVTNQIHHQTSVTTASASCLVDFFCAATERPIGEELDLDLLSLLTNETDEKVKKHRKEFSYKKSKSIKLERENVLSFDNIPIDIDETYTFELDEDTKYLNMFLWTNQYLNKMTKMKSILIGYITIPLYEINVDCWNTTKGETQSTTHFSPIDELKASAISKLSHSHVISDHPGFDSCLSVGSIVINFQHELHKNDKDISALENNADKNLVERTASETSIAQNEDESPVPDDAENDVNIEKRLTSQVVDELLEQDMLRTEFKAELASSEGLANQPTDDGSIHKFSSISFNEIVVCEFCHRKIWLKKAYKCVYCNFIVHIKCYEKTIGKTICDRFYTKNGLKKENDPKVVPKIIIDHEDPFEIIPSPKAPRLAADNSTNHHDEHHTATPRNMMTNFFSGIRQRKWTPSENQVSSNPLTKPSGFLTSFNLHLGNKLTKSV